MERIYKNSLDEYIIFVLLEITNLDKALLRSFAKEKKLLQNAGDI